MINIQDLLIEQSVSLREAICVLDKVGSGFLVVIDENGRLAGVLTDGDIRRALIRGLNIEATIDLIMKKECVSLPVNSSPEKIRSALSPEIHFVPLLDDGGRPVDYASVSRFHRHTVAEPMLNGKEAEYVEECIRTGWVSSQGRFVQKFEEMMADFHGVSHALAVSNGTVALQLALESLGIGFGDEVIVPDFTFAASASAVIHAGATPVLVDVDPQTWVIDPRAVVAAITPQTKAILPVHLYGHPCDMRQLEEIAKAYKLYIIEDCAEALGARFTGQITGTFGDAGCFSFYGNKTLTTGEGGMVLFRHREVYEKAKCLRDHGMSRERRYWHEMVGHNFRLTNLQAAIGVAQMERIEKILGMKEALRQAYDRLLAGFEGVSLPPKGRAAKPVCWLYTLMIEEGLGISRDNIADLLLRNGIETRPVFYPLHSMPAFKKYARKSNFPVASSLSVKGLSLPSAVTLEEEDITQIVAKFRSLTQVRRMKVDAEMGVII